MVKAGFPGYSGVQHHRTIPGVGWII